MNRLRSLYKFVIAILVMPIFLPVQAQRMTPEEEEDWFNSDLDPMAAFNAINEGQLEFLKAKPKDSVHHHQNTIKIQGKSLTDGWTSLIQCHKHLDEFPSAQIVYNEGKIRSLKIDTFKEIEAAWVEGTTIQLRNVKPGAQLCLHAESQALSANEDGTFTLKNGPFMRKFLDGYFPMHVSMNVELPEELRFLSISPPPQTGFTIKHNDKSVRYEAWFEGKLNTEIRFKKIN